LSAKIAKDGSFGPSKAKRKVGYSAMGLKEVTRKDLKQTGTSFEAVKGRL
jgi:hypothetical protein